MSKKKHECTPEEWRRIRDRENEYRRKPEQVARQREYQREYRTTAKSRARDRARYNEQRKNKITDSARRRKYGLTPEQFSDLLALQDYRCAVCQSKFVLEGKERRFIHLDHCHDTKQIRGLLCPYCNAAEGHIRKLGLTPTGFAKRLEHYLAHPPSQEEVLW